MKRGLVPLVLVLASLGSACRADDGSDGTVFPATSGIAHYHGDLFLAVHDTKRDETGLRVSVVTMRPGSPATLSPLSIDWNPAGGTPNDLEAISAVPGRPGEFLVAESGNKGGTRGRIIHLSVSGGAIADLRARVLGKIDLPEDIHNIEGLTVVPAADGLPGLALCERNETKVVDVDSGDGRFAIVGFSRIDLDGHRILGPAHAARIRAEVWPQGQEVRTCTDLYYDVDGAALWLAAAANPSPGGAHESIVYRVDGDPAAMAPEQATLRWRVPGLKVEGLARALAPRLGLTIATDHDEAGGSITSLPEAHE